MTTVAEIAAFLDRFAPAHLAEDWDNTGLLVGRSTATIERLMTCLTVTPGTVAEAVEREVNMIVTHHPMPFVATRRLTDAEPAGAMLLELIAARISVYSPHTAFDSARQGINQRLAEGLELRGISPLVPSDEGLGTGRWGWLADEITLEQLGQRVKAFLAVERIGRVGRPDKPIRTVAVGCGAAGSLLADARAMGCDAMLLGETSFHTYLEAEATDVGLILAGHFHSERFAVEALAGILDEQFPRVDAWASREERDPIEWE